jgi:uncharacterized membrane protein SpoIIM required for sporulation
MLTLKSREFRKEREASWRNLESLVSRAQEDGLASLSTADLREFPLLYRSALSSLSVARAIALDRALVDYLDNLALRSFLAVYSRPLRILDGVRQFLRRDLPAAVRSIAGPIAIVALTLALGILSGFLLVNGDEGWYPVLMPPGMAQGRGPNSTREELLQVLSRRFAAGSALLEMAEYLFSNNTMVSLLIFGLGAAGGVPTLLLTFGNGLMLGAFLALHSHRGLLGQFIGWVAIHGVTELGAVVLFGAAGLKLGEIVLFPGRHSRPDALAIHGPVVGTVAVGGVLMMMVAAVLEGVFRQTITDTDMRLTVAFASLVFWVAYFSLTDRKKDPS